MLSRSSIDCHRSTTIARAYRVSQIKQAMQSILSSKHAAEAHILVEQDKVIRSQGVVEEIAMEAAGEIGLKSREVRR